ncbi:MAG: 2,4-dihydroxyhept-2-ene-1,7-dioic acid aldolase [Betaproteobacteria bacterium]|nr:2,4-dihydroxyhept-2-ene-1,7-dioic acid aldolase [Betaproteobacteria bacterium]
MRRNPIRQRWAEGKPASNLWIDIGWPVTVEALGRLAYDSYTIDMQHSLIDRATLVPLLQALSLGQGAPMVRVTQNDPGEIAFVLDAGAYGVICPTMETPEECARFVAACDYPPRGNRSWGPLRGLMYGGADYFDAYAGEILRIALIETRLGMQNLEAIAATPGLDMIYLGPNDLGVSWGAKPSYTPNHPEVDKAMDQVAAVAKKYGIAAGMHAASPAVARAAVQKGYGLVSLGYAAKIMFTAAGALLQEAFGK